MLLLLLVACRLGDPLSPADGPAGGDDTRNDSAGEDTGPPARPDLLQGFVPTNVVVIATDTLRWDHTPWYGYHRLTMPRLAAREGWITWERAYATSGWTAPSTASMLTGLDIHHHGLRMANEEFGDTLAVETFASRYAAQGLATIFVSGNGLFDLPAGITEGFDAVELLHSEPLNGLDNVARGLDAVDALAPGTPFFLHIQAYDPHQPWWPGPADLGTWTNLDDVPFDVDASRERQQDPLDDILRGEDRVAAAAAEAAVISLYDEELLGLDRAVDALLTGLEERGLLAGTLVVFTSDHGETLFDRGISYGHGTSLYEELVRVPLVFYNPAFTDETVPSCLGSTMDVHPTVFAAMGFPLPDGLDGRPLQDGCRSIVTATIYREQGDPPVVNFVQTAAQTPTRKLLRACSTGEEVGYDLVADPVSSTRLDASDPAFEPLRDALDQVEAEAAGRWPGTVCIGQ